MDRKDRSLITLAGIMMVTSFLVNARAADSPNFNQTSRALKDSVKDNTQKEITQLVEFLLKNGTDQNVGNKFARIMGSKPSPIKEGLIVDEYHGKDITQRLICQLAYEKSSDPDAIDGKRPICFYLTNIKSSGHNEERQSFRVNLNGQLEKAIIGRIKRDDDSNVIKGSGIPIDQDIKSSEAKIAFTAQMAQVKAWLRKQQKVSAAPAASPAPTTP